ncbi:MAG TPA: NADPH-dependent FMN reductase [Vicinamibacteria bacterium]|nr:NADPH-dependent FMN reductase [Vicinamibacteria bacterium]
MTNPDGGASPTLRVLGICGSLRAQSYNRALLRAARDMGTPRMEIADFDLSALPPFNQDVEATAIPEPAAALKRAITEADGLLIASPEYNYGVPGVLKNAIDWASRPPGKSPLSGKPAALMGASMGMGGTIRAQLQLRQAFLFTETHVLLKPEVYVARAQDKIDADGRLTHEPTLAIIRQLLESFAAWIDRFKAPSEHQLG